MEAILSYGIILKKPSKKYYINVQLGIIRNVPIYAGTTYGIVTNSMLYNNRRTVYRNCA